MPIPAFLSTGFLPPGVYRCSWTELVERFTFTERRGALARGLDLVLHEIPGKASIEQVFVDGSFVETTADPGDIDTVIVFSVDRDRKAARELSAWVSINSRAVLQRFSCDLYASDPVWAEQYWMSVFGRRRDGLPKGFLSLTGGWS